MTVAAIRAPRSNVQQSTSSPFPGHDMSKSLLLVFVAILAGIAASFVTYRMIIDQHSVADRDMLDWHPHQPALGR